MILTREWKNTAGDVVGTIHEGVLVRAGTPEKCPSYQFADVEWSSRYRMLVYCDAVVTPTEGNTRTVYFGFKDDLDKAITFVQAHIPLANTTAVVSLDGRIARMEAWETRGAVKPSARARVRRMSKRLFGKPGGDAKVILTDADLSPRFTFDLLFTAYLWRSYGTQEVGFFVRERDICDLVKLRKAIDGYQKLVADDAPATLRDQAKEWLGWRELPDPLTLVF